MFFHADNSSSVKEVLMCDIRPSHFYMDGYTFNQKVDSIVIDTLISNNNSQP